MGNRGDRQQDRGDHPGGRLDIAEKQQAAHSDAGAPEGEQRVEDPVREPGPERERGEQQQCGGHEEERPASHRVHGARIRVAVKRPWVGADAARVEGCAHGMEPAWCFLCRIERSGADPRIAWGLDASDDEGDPEDRPGPMTLAQASYLRFLCDEFGETFDASLTDGQSAIVVASFLDEPMTEAQARTLFFLSQVVGMEAQTGLTYGQARSKIRSLVAIRGLKSA